MEHSAPNPGRYIRDSGPIYDVAKTSDLDALKAQLKEPQDKSLCLRDFCAKHRTIIATRTDANQPIPMIDG
jgi:hypothetical protein